MGQYVDVSLWDNTWTVCKGGGGGEGGVMNVSVYPGLLQDGLP